MSVHGPLAQAVAHAFSPQGALARAADQYVQRPGQTRMALAVAQLIESGEGGALVVEAGTGVGKTFSYLVPALLSGERALLSTATKNLQDQLFARDLPGLARALGLPVRMALLKGRASYLCLHRMEQARHAPTLDRFQARLLARVEQWAQATRSGDLAELPGLDERSALLPLVTSTRENCLGGECPHFKACHVNLARREALAADLVVVNHHLFFADLAVRESGMAELLPSVRLVVFDEAHQLNETGVQFLGHQLSTAQLLDLARDMLGCGLQQARGLADWAQLAGELDRSARELRLVVGQASAASRLRWSAGAPEGVAPQAWQEALDRLGLALADAGAALDSVSELAPDFGRLAQRAAQAQVRAAAFQAPCPSDAVRWVDASTQLRLVESPLDIADAVRRRMLGHGAAVELPDGASAGHEPETSRRAWVFTSATLGDDERLTWFTEPCGLESAQVLRVDSPFDYAAQAALYLPAGLPKPADAGHGAAVAALAAEGAAALGGRTMVLTTTLRALRAIGTALQQRFPAGAGIEVLVQGQQAKRVLIDRFRQGAAPGRGCVLVASASFWEGVDVPGDALQLVVIDKLPFPPPGDPLVEARAQRLEAQGRSAFNDYFIPEAAVALKQGAGRLIRSEHDRGVLMVCDPRLTQMGYGRRLLAALPPMRRLGGHAEFLAELAALAAAPSPELPPGLV